MMFASRFAPFCLLLVTFCFFGCGKAAKKSKPPKPAVASNYAFGEVISFGRGGRSDTFKRGGWGETETEMTWTNAQSVRLSIATPDSAAPLRLRMRLVGFTNPPWLPFQPVAVFVNNEKIADWQVADMADYVAIIPKETANHVQQNIDLRLPEAISPKVLNVSEDTRTLGLACYELAITESNAEEDQQAAATRAADLQMATSKLYSLGTVIDFGAGGAAQRYKGSGWYSAEKDYTWMGKSPAILELLLPRTERPLHLKMKLAGMSKEDIIPSQATEVYANGLKIADWDVSLPDEFDAIIPANLVAQHRKLRLELRTPDAVSPKELQIGNDARVLGVRCEALVITEDQTPLSNAGSPSATPSPKR